jgi:general secretion pathway protein M
VAARHRALEGRIAGGAPRAVDGSSLLGIVDVSARAAGLGAALQRVRPLERAVEVEMEAVRYAELMRWLITLEQGHGVRVANLGLDRTENAGMVNARLRLEPAGR